jgi:hypothetical protein
MTNLRTNKTTAQVISHLVAAWLNKSETQPDMKEIAADASSTLLQTVELQNKIGWNQFMQGRIASNWGEMYNYDLDTQDHGLKKYIGKLGQICCEPNISICFRNVAK